MNLAYLRLVPDLQSNNILFIYFKDLYSPPLLYQNQGGSKSLYKVKSQQYFCSNLNTTELNMNYIYHEKQSLYIGITL